MAEETIVTAIRQLAAAFEGEGVVCELAFDIGSIAEHLSRLAECVRHDAQGRAYLNICPMVE